MRTSRRIHPYIPPELEKRLRALSAAENVTQSALVQAAIQDYLDRDAKDNVLIIKRLDRNARAVARLQRDLDVLAEAFAYYVRWWATYAPELADADKEQGKRKSQRRYANYLVGIAHNLAGGDRFVNQIVKDGPLSDEQGSAAVAGEGPSR